MKRFFKIFILLVFVNLFNTNAQDYSNLWSEVKKFQKNDLPVSVVNKSMEIFHKAQNNRDIGQMMKSYLTAMQYRTYISRDSFEIDIKYLNNWAKDTKSIQERAILYSILGTLSIDNNLQEGFNYLKLSLNDKDILIKTGVSSYVPIVEKGNFSKRYFKDNLYNLLARQAIEQLINNTPNVKENQTESLDKEIKSIDSFMSYKITPASDQDFKAEVLTIYQNLLKEYVDYNYYDAWLLTSLDALTYLNNNYPLSFDRNDYKNQLINLTKKYYKSEACAAVYLSLANEYNNDGNSLEAYKLLNSAIKEYPKYEGLNELKNIEKQITNPALTINIPVLYPSLTDSIKISYKNVKRIYLDIYRLNLPVTSNLLYDTHELDRKLQQYGSVEERLSYKLKSTDDFKMKDTLFPISIKKPGIYYFRVAEDNSHRLKNGEVVYVSSLKVINRPLADKKLEIIVVDAKEGNPIPYATFNTYQRNGDRFSVIKRYNADNKGVAVLDKDESLYYNVSYPDDNAMPITNMWMRTYGYNDTQKEEEHIKIFTDRSIYKPGQRVYVGGFAYVQNNDSLSALNKKSLEAKLYDSNRNLIAKNEIETNEFGSFGLDFKIPQNILTGRFSIMIDKSMTSFRVEEYKQPTFDVELEPYKKAYNANDTVIIKGIAKTFTDIPIQNGKVRYTIKRNQLWRWNNSLKNWEGETMTNENGEFSIPVFLDVDEATLKGKSWYYNFSINADVVNNVGETENGDINIPLTYSSLIIKVKGLNKVILKEKKDSILFEVLNINNQKVNTKVLCSIYSIKKGENGSRKVLDYVYDSNVKMIPSDIYSLPDGSYKMIVEVTDLLGRKINETAEFMMFSDSSKRPPLKTVDLFYKSSDTFVYEQPVDIYIGSSREKVYLFYSLFSGNKRLENKTILLNDSIMKFSYSYKKEYGDGVLASFAFMKDGKLYNHNVRIIKPKPNDKLVMKWSSFRDKMTPGENEQWKLNVLYPNGEPANAQILASMFDASLNEIYAHDWQFNIDYKRFIPFTSWNSNNYSSRWINFDFPLNLYRYKGNEYNKLFIPSMYIKQNARGLIYTESLSSKMMLKSAMPDKILNASIYSAPSTMYRSNFAETAFFYPFIKTDKNGEATINFTLPESLTTWQFMSIAHTKDMKYSQFKSTVVARKEFMVQPNMPRFIRVGDETQIEVSIMNLTDKKIEGNISFELFNPVTTKIINKQIRKFTVDGLNKTKAVFIFKVDKIQSFIACRVIADGDGFSDGEQRIIPILDDKQWITESHPISMSKSGVYNYNLNKLFNINPSTSTNRRFTAEFTSHPIWYAIQALPIIALPKGNNSYSYALAYYANSLSKYIINSNPRVKQILDNYSSNNSSMDKDEFLSNLEKNSDLKNIILKETPWIAEAENEKQQKERLTTLFDLNTFNARNAVIVQKLIALQNQNGSWSWYKGMSESKFITLQIVELFARLGNMTNNGVSREEQDMYRNAVSYINGQMKAEYESDKKKRKNSDIQFGISKEMIQYLYISTIDKSIEVDNDLKEYYIKKILKEPSKLDIYEKALSAMILYDNKMESEAYNFLESIMQYSVFDKIIGRYFDSPKAVYSFMDYKIPTETAVIEALNKISSESKGLDEMKQWILSQKRIQQWSTPVATANAVYALMTNSDSLKFASGDNHINLLIDNKPIDKPSNNIEGYIKVRIPDDAGKIPSLTIDKKDNGLSWGAIYAQYCDKISNLKSFGKGLTITKSLWINGKKTTNTQTFKVGDKIKIRLTFNSAYDMDFVSIKDGFASCMQPKDNLSGYNWNQNISYYKAVDNASISFFIDKLNKGEYSIDYEVYLNRPGNYRTGVCEIQSAYAPEYSGAGESISIKVE